MVLFASSYFNTAQVMCWGNMYDHCYFSRDTSALKMYVQTHDAHLCHMLLNAEIQGNWAFIILLEVSPLRGLAY